jgi:oligopeptide transport system permease protein
MGIAALPRSTGTQAAPRDSLLSRKPRSLWIDARDRLLRNRAAVAGMIIILVFGLIAVFARQVAPHSPLAIYKNNQYRLAAWVDDRNPVKDGNWMFPLGSDANGRDVLSRVIFGARVSMVVAIVPMLVIVIVGVSVGLYSGWKGGWADMVIMRIGDVLYAFPGLLFFVIIMAALRETWVGQLLNGMFLLFFALSLVNWVGLARQVRGQVLALREKEFIEAARSIGASDLRIMYQHLVPNTLGPIIVSVAFGIPNLIIVEAALGYLGIGLRPATDPSATFITSWGVLLNEGQQAIFAQPWLLLAPAICVALVVISFNFVGDGLRDALDPRMRGTS